MLFPVKCTGCGEKGEILCSFCAPKIGLVENKVDENILAVFDYKDPIIKKVIWELKYHNKHYLGQKIGQLLYENLIEDISDMKTEVSGRSIYVIPVPISKKKEKKRGYNQTLAIAKGFCNSGDRKIFELKNKIVVKKINTTPQARITNRKRRLENVKGVFELKNKEIIKGRTIIVIDDVTTTGGTMKEMIKILKNAGAKRVVGFAVAH